MQNIDYITLNAFLEENIDFFIGARLQKIQQPTRRDFIFQLRNNGESRKFYININPQFYHVTFMSKENEERRALTIPKQPPTRSAIIFLLIIGADAAAITDTINSTVIISINEKPLNLLMLIPRFLIFFKRAT